MTTLNNYLHVSKTIPESTNVNRLELTEPSTVKTTASEIKFFKDGADTEDGEALGKITFYGKDSGNNETQFGEITGSINESDNTDEAGILELKVAESDGTTSTITTGLKLTGKPDTDGVVDVELGSNISSTTSIKGSLTIPNNPLSVVSGGTGQTTYTDGQLLIGNTTGNTLAKAVLTEGSNVSITNGSGSITIASTDTNTTYTAGDGLDLNGTTFSTDLKSNGGLLIESTELAVDLGASSITGTLSVSDGGTGATSPGAARTALGVDAAGTDNSTDVTLANTNYLSISGQDITGGTVPLTSGGTGATTAAGARTALNVDPAGTDNSTTFNTISVSGQTDVVADSSTDTLTLVGGSNMTITTDATSDTITFASSGGGGVSESSSNSFRETQIIKKDTDGEFIALKLQNNSDAADTTGKVSIEFNLEDTSGSDADAGKISVVKNQSFTSTASTQDSTMEFYSALDGGLAKVCDFTSGQHVEIQGGLKIGLGGLDYGSYGPSNDSTRGQLFIQTTYNGNTDDSYGWWIGTQDQSFDSSDNDLHFVVARGESSQTSYNIAGFIQDNPGSGSRASQMNRGLNQSNFTGQHRCFINNELSDMIGLLVSSTGIYVNIDNSNQPSINESLPICQLSTLTNDKSVFGVVSEKEDSNSNRTYKPSNFVSVYPKTNTNERRYHINSLGEGSIWITNKNDNLQNGDYITTSTIPGYGQKQTETELHNFTVAKITCSCNFSITKINKRKVKVIVSESSQTLDLDSSGNIQFEDDLDSDGNQQQVYPFETRFLLADGTQITETEYTTRLTNNESVYIACFVGCTYHCG